MKQYAHEAAGLESFPTTTAASVHWCDTEKVCRVLGTCVMPVRLAQTNPLWHEADAVFLQPGRPPLTGVERLRRSAREGHQAVPELNEVLRHQPSGASSLMAR